MDWIPDNIRVALTSTRYITTLLLTDKRVKEIDCPICVAEMDLSVFGSMLQKKDLESISLLCMQELKDVNIDVEKRTVMVGDESCPLVLFNARPKGVSMFEDSFFKRWAVYKMMIFEMQFIIPKGIIAISSIYDDCEKKWTEPKSHPPKIQILHVSRN